MIVKAKNLKSWREKSEGLLKHDHPENIFFKSRWGVHTFFMKFPIDIVILDNKNHVVKLKKSLKPNRIIVWNPKYFNVLELPEGFIQKNKLKIGLHIKLDLI